MRKLSLHYVVESVLLIALILTGLYAWRLSGDKTSLNKQLIAAKSDPQAIIQQQTYNLIQQVGSLISLPTGETPTIAAVTDVDQAKKQSSFFANAQNGDKILLYVKAGKAVLYRPTTNKIIEYAPLTITNAAATGTTAVSDP